jgi:hypothetical protein
LQGKTVNSKLCRPIACKQIANIPAVSYPRREKSAAVLACIRGLQVVFPRLGSLRLLIEHRFITWPDEERARTELQNS